METMTNELTVIPGTIGMMGGMGMLKPEFIEDAVKVVFYGDCGVLTETSNAGNTFNIYDARNSGAC